MNRRSHKHDSFMDGITPGGDARADAAREIHRRHIAVWVASGGTLAVIVALWAMLLPTQLAGSSSFGLRNTPSWKALQAKSEATSTDFQASLQTMRTQLDQIEEEQRTAAARQAAEQSAAALRTRVETSATASADGDTEQKNQPQTP